ncbi:MAG: hypothetical protein IIB63_09595 [Proteobacteria bacterium]|nr:hypothetical protein [Pseudomonadota bacterium]
MKQAKVLTDMEMKRLLAVIANGRHAERNRLAVLLSHLAGLRVAKSPRSLSAMSWIARARFPPTRRAAYAISMSHDQRSLV